MRAYECNNSTLGSRGAGLPVNEVTIAPPRQEPDMVNEWFEVPKEAELIDLSPIKLRFKGLCFSSMHVHSKMLPWAGGLKVLIAPTSGAIALRDVADLFRVAPRYVPVAAKVSKSEIFQASTKVMAGEVGAEVGWSPDQAAQIISLAKPSEALRKFLEKPSTIASKVPNVSPWAFTSSDVKFKALLETLAMDRCPSAHLKFGRTLQGAWGEIPIRMWKEDKGQRQEALVHLALHEGLVAVERVLDYASSLPRDTSEQTFNHLCAGLSYFVSSLKSVEEKVFLDSLSRVADMKSRLRRKATDGMAPASLVNVLLDAEMFSPKGELFPNSALETAEAIATEKSGLTFRPAKLSLEVCRQKHQAKVSGRGAISGRASMSAGRGFRGQWRTQFKSGVAGIREVVGNARSGIGNARTDFFNTGAASRVTGTSRGQRFIKFSSRGSSNNRLSRGSTSYSFAGGRAFANRSAETGRTNAGQRGAHRVQGARWRGSGLGSSRQFSRQVAGSRRGGQSLA